MTLQQKNKQLKHFLSYVLGRHPEEFGLIPDETGFVKIKELLKAVNETEGWRHIRESNITELLLLESNPPFEISDDWIRSKDHLHLSKTVICREVPKILHTCVRKKAYPHVLEKGIFPAGAPYVICTPDKETALRIGRRKDRNAVLLTVHTTKTANEGVSFQKFTDIFYMTEHIPANTFTGPPLPKISEKEKSTKPAVKPQKEIGAFLVTANDIEPAANKKTKGKKKKVDWKQDRKHSRKKNKDAWSNDL